MLTGTWFTCLPAKGHELTVLGTDLLHVGLLLCPNITQKRKFYPAVGLRQECLMIAMVHQALSFVKD